jgi:hypothetical protein
VVSNTRPTLNLFGYICTFRGCAAAAYVCTPERKNRQLDQISSTSSARVPGLIEKRAE